MSKSRIRAGDLVEKGARLRRIREMANLTSQELANRTGFSRQSVSYWENGSQNGLSFQGAEASIRVVREQSIVCEFAWLWKGEGEEPYSLLDRLGAEAAEGDTTVLVCPDDERAKEIQLFKLNYENAAVLMVKNQTMKPIYQKEDWVGGRWRTLTPKLIGQPCIIEVDGVLQLRLVKKGDVDGYHFSFLTYSEEVREPFELADLNPEKVAPIIRVWRKG